MLAWRPPCQPHFLSFSTFSSLSVVMDEPYPVESREAAASTSNVLASCDDEEGDSGLVDITSLIDECAAALDVRYPFVCDTDTFNLHDSMAATQLMDRKMDCCEIPASHYMTAGTAADDEDKVVFPRPVPESLDDPFSPLPWNELTITEAACIGVQILVRFQAFLSGSSVGESTFTCLSVSILHGSLASILLPVSFFTHLIRSSYTLPFECSYAHADVLSDMKSRLFSSSSSCSVKDGTLDEGGGKQSDTPGASSHSRLVVFACALALVEATDVVRSIILNADIYEEEDFAPNTYDIPFYVTAEEMESNDEGGDGGRGEMATVKVLERALKETKTIELEAIKSEDNVRRDGAEVILLVLSFLSGFLTVTGNMVRMCMQWQLCNYLFCELASHAVNDPDCFRGNYRHRKCASSWRTCSKSRK